PLLLRVGCRRRGSVRSARRPVACRDSCRKPLQKRGLWGESGAKSTRSRAPPDTIRGDGTQRPEERSERGIHGAPRPAYAESTMRRIAAVVGATTLLAT